MKKIKKINVVGKRLRELRESAGLSRRALAEKCSVAQMTIAGCELGYERQRNLQMRTLQALAEGLGVRVSELLEVGNA